MPPPEGRARTESANSATRPKSAQRTTKKKRAPTPKQPTKRTTKKRTTKKRATKKRATAKRATTPKGSAPKRKTTPTTVAIVGAGRLGTALALALDSRGYSIDALVSRRRKSAERAARTLSQSHPLALSAFQLAQLPAVDLLFITTPDDLIEQTAASLAAAPRAGERRAKRVVLHASGALSSGVLAPLRARGFAVGSLHPLVSVSDPAAAARDFREAFFCVEGDAAAVRLARRLVRELGGRAFSVAARDKALYHASAVLVAGHSVALFDLASAVLGACGLSAREARSVLLPLARSALSNLSAARTNAAALTGPFARGDAATVRRHLSAFARHGGAGRLADAEKVYALLGAASVRLAASSGGLDAAAVSELARALSEVLGTHGEGR